LNIGGRLFCGAEDATSEKESVLNVNSVS